MGIHGEPGREQMHLPATGAADKVAQLLVAGILDQGTSKAAPDEAVPAEVLKRLSYSAGQRLVVLLNNLGALPVIEMQIVARGVMQELLRRDLVPVRAYVGPFVTSLEMCGVSLSLIVLPDNDDGKMRPVRISSISIPALFTCLAEY
jgi:dihydroxyacetone kinase